TATKETRDNGAQQRGQYYDEVYIFHGCLFSTLSPVERFPERPLQPICRNLLCTLPF
ncbi:hypothetical protein Ga0076813_15072, partial [endosymbiont of Ridgeia piscesae]